MRLRKEVRARWPRPTFSDTETKNNNHNNNNNENPLLSQIENIPYLRAVVDEVLRIHPATIVSQREARQGVTMTGIPIPKGTMLVIPPIATNLNTWIWVDNVAAFGLDRWLQGKPASRSTTAGGGCQQTCSIMTFGLGPQGCPGRSVTRLILMCMAAAFVNKYEVSLEDPLQDFVPSEALSTFPTPELVVRLVKVSEP
ncbi:cytochrome P450 [Aspergillus germanicus]